MTELPATLLLRATGVDMRATALWTQRSVSACNAASPHAALLVLLAAVPSWWLTARTGFLVPVRGG
ncbi:hypothetical protein ACFYNL_36545 [Streptomyces sp. NPDC007808]|uniref:hypothetical protein n=1 Tax=Streptomyces sp. NPDC007808 TaxID=3364779 RepID=UPI0036AE54A5